MGIPNWAIPTVLAYLLPGQQITTTPLQIDKALQRASPMKGL
jgi:hypothetical protein